VSRMHNLDAIRHNTLWICEKWSDEAVNFATKKLERNRITHLPAENREIHAANGRVLVVPRLMPIHEGISSLALREIVGPPEECAEIQGNLLLNEGIQLVINLTMIASGLVSNQTATNYWSNTNSYIGVGDSTTAEAATQTDLSAATNHFYKVMNATYPSRSNQTVSFQSDFTTAEANYVWNEWSVSAGATSASGSGFLVGTTNLNRKVASLGTKSSGTWTLTAQITFS
jgi:hypothetical protein